MMICSTFSFLTLPCHNPFLNSKLRDIKIWNYFKSQSSNMARLENSPNNLFPLSKQSLKADWRLMMLVFAQSSSPLGLLLFLLQRWLTVRLCFQRLAVWGTGAIPLYYHLAMPIWVNFFGCLAKKSLDQKKESHSIIIVYLSDEGLNCVLLHTCFWLEKILYSWIGKKPELTLFLPLILLRKSSLSKVRLPHLSWGGPDVI